MVRPWNCYLSIYSSSTTTYPLLSSTRWIVSYSLGASIGGLFTYLRLEMERERETIVLLKNRERDRVGHAICRYTYSGGGYGVRLRWACCGAPNCVPQRQSSSSRRRSNSSSRRCGFPGMWCYNNSSASLLSCKCSLSWPVRHNLWAAVELAIDIYALFIPPADTEGYGCSCCCCCCCQRTDTSPYYPGPVVYVVVCVCGCVFMCAGIQLMNDTKWGKEDIEDREKSNALLFAQLPFLHTGILL